jgi:hypothetical protein
MPAEGVHPLGAYIKLRKKSRQLQTARKNLGEIPMLYAGFGEPMTGDEKIFRP